MNRWFVLAVAVIVLDQYTKYLAEAHLVLGTPEVVIDGFFNLRLTYNPGAAFSFLGDAGGWQRWFFIALALAVSTWLVNFEAGLRRMLFEQGIVTLPSTPESKVVAHNQHLDAKLVDQHLTHEAVCLKRRELLPEARDQDKVQRRVLKSMQLLSQCRQSVR